jgi:dimethylaniline monooxygenase (N-oxide forming)
VKNGSIVIKKSQSFSFYKDGLIINGESKPHETDLVILATGYKGDQKLRSIFRSSIFQNYMNGSINSAIPLYR